MSRKSPILIPIAAFASIIGALGMSAPAMAAEEVWTYADMVDYQTEALQTFVEQCSGSEDEKTYRRDYYDGVRSYDMMMGTGINNPKMQAYLNSINLPITMTAYSPTNKTMNFYTDYENMLQRLLGETDPAVYSDIPEEFFLVWIKSSLVSTYATTKGIGGGRISVKYADEIRAGHSLPSGIEVLYSGSKDQPNWITPGKEFSIVSDKFQSLYKRTDGNFYIFYRSEQQDLSFWFNFLPCTTWPGYTDAMDCVDIRTSYGNYGMQPIASTVEYRLAVKPGYVDPSSVIPEEEGSSEGGADDAGAGDVDPGEEGATSGVEADTSETPTEPVNTPEDSTKLVNESESNQPVVDTVAVAAEVEPIVVAVPASFTTSSTSARTGVVGRSNALTTEETMKKQTETTDERKNQASDSNQTATQDAIKTTKGDRAQSEQTPEVAVPTTNHSEAGFPWLILLIGLLGVGLALWWLVPVWHKKDTK